VSVATDDGLVGAGTGSGLTLNSSGLLDNDLLTGKAGGQTVIGGTATGESLTLRGTTHATPGKILIFDATPIAGAVDSVKIQSLDASAYAIFSAATGLTFGYTGNAVNIALAAGATYSSPSHLFKGRVAIQLGTSVASAGTLTLASSIAGGGNSYPVTGTTAINYITTSAWLAGAEVTLVFAGACPVNHNTGSVPGGTAAILLNGSANRTYVANGTLKLIYNGTNWIEIPRIT
jgi:hypothetical protein